MEQNAAITLKVSCFKPQYLSYIQAKHERKNSYRINLIGLHLLCEIFTQDNQKKKWNEHRGIAQRALEGQDVDRSGYIACMISLHRGKELVEIKRQRVEFFAPRVRLEWSELIPPVITSVFPCSTVVPVERVVQEKRHESGNEGLWWEYHVYDVVEL